MRLYELHYQIPRIAIVIVFVKSNISGININAPGSFNICIQHC